MGGSSYDVSVGTADSGRSYSTGSARTFSGTTQADSTVVPDKTTKLSTDVKHPVVVALDVTGSMGDSARIMYDKMPMFWGQIEQQGYLTDPALSFCCVGDVFSDRAPLQVTPFEKAKAIHPWLKKLWLEGGGGGTMQESYDMAAAFYVNQCDIPNAVKPFFFFIGDEGYYPKTDGFPNDVVFQGLMEKFEVFHIHWPYCGGRYTQQDEAIVAQWRTLMAERFLLLPDPKAIVDTMLGLIAMVCESRTLDEYIQDMRDRGQSEERIETVTTTITSYTESLAAKPKAKSTKKAKPKKAKK